EVSPEEKVELRLRMSATVPRGVGDALELVLRPGPGRPCKARADVGPLHDLVAWINDFQCDRTLEGTPADHREIVIGARVVHDPGAGGPSAADLGEDPIRGVETLFRRPAEEDRGNGRQA